MPEQDIEMQILEELQKLKVIVSKFHEAEKAYRNSSEILDKAIKEYSNLSELREELNEHVHTIRENLQKTELANTKKMDYLNGEFAKLTIKLPQDVSSQFNEVKDQVEKLTINLPKDISPQFNEVKDQVEKSSSNINSILEQLSQVKKQQASNTTNIRLGLFLIFLVGLLVLVFK